MMTMIVYEEDLCPPDADPAAVGDDTYHLNGKHVSLTWCKDEPVVAFALQSGMQHDADDYLLHGVMAEITIVVLRELVELVRHPRFADVLAIADQPTDSWPVRNADFCDTPDEPELIREPFYE